MESEEKKKYIPVPVYCPRCGRKGIVVNENDYQCPSCSTSYRKINIDDIECLWLKSLGR